MTVAGTQEQSVPTDTILVKEDGVWKVDWARTSAAMYGSMVGEMMKGMEKAMTGMGEEMGKAMEKAAKEQNAPPQ